MFMVLNFYFVLNRFWYENPGVFAGSQLTELKQTTLARVICDNSDGIQFLQSDVFVLAQYPSGQLSCEDNTISRVDLKVWAHCCQGKNAIVFFG